NPNDAELNTKMGNLLFDSGKYSEAIPYYQKSIQLQPNNPDVIVDLGVCYFNLEQYEKAKEQFELAYQIDSQHVNALYNLGVVSIQLGEVNKLIKYWGELRDIAPNSQQAQRATQILNQIHQNVEQGAGSGQGQGS
ncbi:tetratricopeptide repeat protein, partial [Candidatus Saccharibacteria bacterium]|nr:tetratricopeptide repeat protein [Candidatus Saccharibacteria bacterium]NIV04006.1 tetratricopeptide repeat protein [Calditrichia bacterium]NIV72537.1 tetratricopeptide repeat protein [Calditrichia bacterium]NIV99433.1 tetratricopeptide repeat protein [Candidatus Saccharibacteria bacterium]NIW80724.1 tetratricopeptide repeat protein [Calditrichia bacterium]